MAMEKHFIFLLLPLTFVLPSCNENENAPLIELSGTFAFSFPADSDFKGFQTNRDAASLIKEAEAGIPTYVLFASETCKPCNEMKPHFIETMKATKRNIYVFDYDSNDVDSMNVYEESVSAFKQKYGEITSDESHGIDGATPRLFRLTDKEAILMDIYSDMRSTTKFKNFIEYNTKATSFYRFFDLSRFSEASLETGNQRYCLYDSSDEQSISEYKKEFDANNDLKTYVLDYGALTPNDKASALEIFGLSEYEFTVTAALS